MPTGVQTFSAEILNEIIDAVPNAMLVKDEQHRWILVNETLCTAMGRSRSELLNGTDFDFVSAEQARKNWASDDLVLTTGEPNEIEVEYPQPEGGVRTVVVRKRRLFLPHPDGSVAPAVVVVLVDVTKFRRAEEQARSMALHDSLTGIPNRLHFDQSLMATLKRGRQSMEKFALLLFDLDDFKEVNDQWGHAYGDQVLRVVGQRLMGSVRDADTAARLGGDEFGVIQLSDDQPSASIRLAGRLSRVLSVPIRIFETRITLSASIGFSVYPEHGIDAETLLRRADAALYGVKNGGKSNYAIAA